MSNEKMCASFRMLMLITTPKLGEKALALFEREKLPMQCQAYAHGTASREMMDMLGLDSGEKSLLLSMMPKANADELLKQLRRELRLGASRKRHRVYDTAERHESANAANGRADLRGAAS